MSLGDQGEMQSLDKKRKKDSQKWNYIEEGKRKRENVRENVV